MTSHSTIQKNTWWTDWYNNYESANNNISILFSHNENLVGIYYDYICNVDFADLPGAMVAFYEENK